MLLNTSFNQAGEPIVCTPADALLCFVNARLDALVLEDWLFDRAATSEVRLFSQSRTSSLVDSPADGIAVPANWPELAAAWVSEAPLLSAAVCSPLDENLYTFV